MTGEIETNTSDFNGGNGNVDSPGNTSNDMIEINKKKCISNLISGSLLVHKRGGLNLFQSRDLANAIDSFADKNNTNQLNNINLLITVLEIGQSKGVFDINESRALANILDILSDEEKLTQMDTIMNTNNNE